MDHCIFIIIIIIDSHMIIVTVTLSSSAPRTFGVNRGCMELQEAALAASWYEGFHRLEYFASGTFNLELGIISAFSLNVIQQINSIHIHI